MDANEYQTVSEKTLNFGPYDLRQVDIKLLNAAVGLSGEAGEVLDRVKKIVFHGHKVDYQKIREELGDSVWYIAAICTILGFNLSTVMQENVRKLQKRYPNGFSREDSINRTE